MLSIVTKSGEYLDRLVRSGLLQEIEDRRDTETSTIEQRRAWAAELAAIPARRAKELPPLEKAAERAIAEDILAAEKALAARKTREEVVLRGHYAQASIDGRERQLTLWLEGVRHPQQPGVEEKPIPAILLHLRDRFERIELMRVNLGYAAHATEACYRTDDWGHSRYVGDIWNTDQIEAARHKLEDLQDELRSLMRQPDFDPPKQRSRSDELLHIAEVEVEPLFKDTPIEDFYRREKLRLFGAKQAA